MDKMRNNPYEIQTFIRENREMVLNELNDKLDQDSRPTPQQMIELGYLPNGSYGYYQMQNMNEEESMNSPTFTASDSSETEIDPLDGEKINKSPKYREELETKSEESGPMALYEEKEEEMRDLLAMKNEQIRALMNENEALKEERLRDEKGKKIKDLLMENERLKNEQQNRMNDLHSLGELDDKALNTFRRLLYAAQAENKELRVKYKQSSKALEDMEKSKLELLRIFNSEMDRMREEIKKLNALISTE